MLYFFFFFNDTATTEIYTLSLHDALPISIDYQPGDRFWTFQWIEAGIYAALSMLRSEEHTSELQSPCNLVCRLLLEKKKKNSYNRNYVCTNQISQSDCSTVILFIFYPDSQ